MTGPTTRGEGHPPVPVERMKTIARNLRRLAGQRGMAIAHLADHAGIGRTTMWRILDVNDRGPSDPRLSTLDALAEALDVDVIELLRPVVEAAS